MPKQKKFACRHDGFYRALDRACSASVRDPVHKGPTSFLLARALLACPGFTESGLPKSWHAWVEKYPDFATIIRRGVANLCPEPGVTLQPSLPSEAATGTLKLSIANPKSSSEESVAQDVEKRPANRGAKNVRQPANSNGFGQAVGRKRGSRNDMAAMGAKKRQRTLASTKNSVPQDSDEISAELDRLDELDELNSQSGWESLETRDKKRRARMEDLALVQKTTTALEIRGYPENFAESLGECFGSSFSTTKEHLAEVPIDPSIIASWESTTMATTDNGHGHLASAEDGNIVKDNEGNVTGGENEGESDTQV